MSWEPMDTAPRDGREPFDVWIRGSLEDVEFYCHTHPVAYRGGAAGASHGGVSAGWVFRAGRFRPHTGVTCMPCSVEPLFWRPAHAPPESERELLQ